MQGQRPRAFLVDDNDGLRTAIRELLTDAGVDVVGDAPDSGTALLRIPPAATTSPLVVLMDVRLPGPVNGIEATRRLLEQRADVHVVIFTAFNSPAIERAALAAGAVAVLIKGAPADTVLATILGAWTAAALAS
jgi:DNA-binding NarL/FixJ family response regulator